MKNFSSNVYGANKLDRIVRELLRKIKGVLPPFTAADAGKVPKVNAAGTEVEWKEDAGLPPFTAADAGKVPKVNAAGTEVEWKNQEGKKIYCHKLSWAKSIPGTPADNIELVIYNGDSSNYSGDYSKVKGEIKRLCGNNVTGNYACNGWQDSEAPVIYNSLFYSDATFETYGYKWDTESSALVSWSQNVSDINWIDTVTEI